MSLPEAREYDVIVAGGGPAGATAAALVARGGHRVLLLEKDPEPRFKVGESLMPASYWTLERLGVLERMKGSPFPRKYSVQFFSGSGRAAAPFYFFETNPHESSGTWQVLRSEFDAMLLDNAAAEGAEVCRGTAVREVLFEGERAVGVRVQAADGEEVEIASRVVVDATGQRALLARSLGLAEVEPELRNASLFTHFEGARRDEGVDAGATLILHTEGQRSWFWFIPLPEDRASVGVVGPVETLVQGRQADPQAVFDEELARCPALRPRLADARQAMPVRAIRDFSYKSRRASGDGWVLVGDAWGFVDPIYSSGVFLALKSGELAADALCAGLAEGDLSGDRLGRFLPDFSAGVEALRRLVYAFYDESFSFGRFVQRFPEHREALVHMLVGDVFDRPTGDLLRAIDRMRRESAAEATPVEAGA